MTGCRVHVSKAIALIAKVARSRNASLALAAKTASENSSLLEQQNQLVADQTACERHASHPQSHRGPSITALDLHVAACGLMGIQFDHKGPDPGG